MTGLKQSRQGAKPREAQFVHFLIRTLRLRSFARRCLGLDELSPSFQALGGRSLRRCYNFQMRSYCGVHLLAAVIGLGSTLGFAAGQNRAKPSPANGAAGPQNGREFQPLAEKAFQELRRDDYAAAISDYETLTAADPKVPEFHANLCVAYYSIRRFAEASRACRQALTVNPKLESPKYFLPLSLAEGGECPQAIPLLNSAFAAAKDPAMKRQLGVEGANCSMQIGDADHATRFVLGLARDFPSDPDVLYLGSRVYSALSTGFSQRLLQVAPGSYQAHQFNAEVLEYQGKNQDAMDEYRKVLALNPNLLGIHDRLGKLLLASGSDDATLKAARQQFDDELHLDPENVDAEYQLGQMDWKARQYDSAVGHFRRAAQIEPHSADILVALGQALVSAGQIKEALEPLETAVKLAPDYSTAHYQLAFVLRHLGRNEEAGKELALYDELHKKDLAAGAAIRQGMQENPLPPKPPQ